MNYPYERQRKKSDLKQSMITTFQWYHNFLELSCKPFSLWRSFPFIWKRVYIFADNHKIIVIPLCNLFVSTFNFKVIHPYKNCSNRFEIGIQIALFLWWVMSLFDSFILTSMVKTTQNNKCNMQVIQKLSSANTANFKQNLSNKNLKLSNAIYVSNFATLVRLDN